MAISASVGSGGRAGSLERDRLAHASSIIRTNSYVNEIIRITGDTERFQKRFEEARHNSLHGSKDWTRAASHRTAANASEVVREGLRLLKEQDEIRVRWREQIERGWLDAPSLTSSLLTTLTRR